MGKHTNHSHSQQIQMKQQTEPEVITITSKQETSTLNSKPSETTLANERNGTPENNDCTLKYRTKAHEESSGRRSAEKSSLSMADEDENSEEMDGDGDDVSIEGDDSGLPIDRGWAWVVMTAQFVITFLMVGYGRALSIFFLEFLAIFEVSVTTVTIVMGLMIAFFGIGNVVVSHVLMARFSTRQVMLAGALLNSTSIALTALAPNMVYVTVMHCFIGFTHALLFVPGVTLVGHYFNKRRSFAMAVTNTGLSVSALVFPPLTQFLVTFYGLRGALLLVAGIELQCVVAACLLRPVSWYTKRKIIKRSRNNSQPLIEGEVSKFSHSAWDRSKEEEGCEGERDTARTRLLVESSKLGDHQQGDVLLQQHSPVSWEHDTDSPNPLSMSLPEKTFHTNQSENCHGSGEMSNIPQSHKINISSSVYDRQQSCPEEYLHTSAKFREKRLTDSSPKITALSSSVVNICGSTMTIATDAMFVTSSNAQVESLSTESSTRNRGCRGRCLSVVSAVIDVSLFKNWLFLLIIVYVPLGFSGGFIAFYFPSLGVEQGLSRPRAALLMTVSGGVDLVSRLCVGYLADLQLVKRTHLVIVCMTLTGLASQLCRWYSNFGLLTVYAVTYGLLGGVCNNLFAVVIIDLLGLHLLGKVMGLVLLVNSGFTALNHILIGALVDTTGSFIIPYHYVGASLFLSSLILLLEPLARRLEAKRVKKLAADVHCTRQPVQV